MILWLVGLSASGKTTIARHLLGLWRETRSEVVLLDGEPLRSPDLTVDNGHPSEDAATLAQRILAAAHRKQRQSLARPPLASPAAAGATA